MFDIFTVPTLLSALLLLLILKIFSGLYGLFKVRKQRAYAPKSDRKKVLADIKQVIDKEGYFSLSEDEINESAKRCNVTWKDFHIYVAILEEQRKLQRSFEDGKPILYYVRSAFVTSLKDEDKRFAVMIEKDKSTNYVFISSTLYREQNVLHQRDIYYSKDDSLAKVVKYELRVDGKELIKFERISERWS